jgi:heme/copper-type cytochrome/quinol oxidase subunit 2
MNATILFKVALVLLLLFIILNLALALIRMVRDEPDDAKPMSHYLGKRVVVSAIVIILLIIALQSGLITPNPRPY